MFPRLFLKNIWKNIAQKFFEKFSSHDVIMTSSVTWPNFEILKYRFWVHVLYTVGKRNKRAFQRALNQLSISIRCRVMSILVISQSEGSISKIDDVISQSNAQKIFFHISIEDSSKIICSYFLGCTMKNRDFIMGEGTNKPPQAIMRQKAQAR